MRVLFVSAPLVGHLLPMVPLARALSEADHEVLIASGGEAFAGPDIGLPTTDVVPSFHFGRIAGAIMLRHPLIARAELAGTAGVRGVSLLFGAVNERLADGVLAAARSFAPDLVIYEPLAVAGALAAARLGVPAVRHEAGLFDGAVLTPSVAGRMRATLPAAAASVTIAPPGLVGERSGWPMRSEAADHAGDLPDWLREPAARPRIAVSRSTVAGPGGGNHMSAVIAAAPAVEAEFVLVRPDRATNKRALPDNVRTVEWAPLARVLASCAGIVHHAGAGTVLTAIGAGVPQLAVPGAGDRRHNAELVAARGVGLAVPEKSITAAALTRLIADPALRARTAEVRAELIAMPPPADIVGRLESRFA